MGVARLGNYSFRLDPEDISYSYQIDYSVIDTLGGQVVQVLGATIGDITVRGSFGQDHRHNKMSWEMAEDFHSTIRQMMDQQSLPHQGHGGPIHQPIHFTYMDGTHDWDFKVLIKAVADSDGEGSITHSNGKYAYGYVLTLFLVEDRSLKLQKITTDKFIARIANGLGWKRSGFNGSMTLAAAMDFITSHSTDGSVYGYLSKLLQDPPQQQIGTGPPPQTTITPGGGGSRTPGAGGAQ